MAYYLKNIINSPLKDVSKLKVTSGFGKRSYYDKYKDKYVSDNHHGIDIVGSNTIVAFKDGVVVAIRDSIKGYSSKYTKGNFVTIDHGNGMMSTYMHMKYKSIKVVKGMKVQMGDILGTVGSTGNSMSPHLHFAITIKNKWVNPEKYLISKNEQSSKYEYYIVKPKDNLSKIAKKYNTTWKSIYEINKDVIGKNPNLIKVGQRLKIKKG